MKTLLCFSSRQGEREGSAPGGEIKTRNEKEGKNKRKKERKEWNKEVIEEWRSKLQQENNPLYSQIYAQKESCKDIRAQMQMRYSLNHCLSLETFCAKEKNL